MTEERPVLEMELHELVGKLEAKQLKPGHDFISAEELEDWISAQVDDLKRQRDKSEAELGAPIGPMPDEWQQCTAVINYLNYHLKQLKRRRNK